MRPNRTQPPQKHKHRATKDTTQKWTKHQKKKNQHRAQHKEIEEVETAFFIPRPQPQTTELTLHNLSTYNLTTADYQLLEKGLSFAPTVRLPPTTLQHQILQSFNHFAKLRLRYMRVTGSSSKPHEHQPKHCTAAHLYRPMKFLPKPKVETPLERLEAYIDNTKQMLADNLPTLCSNHSPNLTALQQNALTKHKSTRQTLTIKPADKNLGIGLHFPMLTPSDWSKNIQDHTIISKR